jgi:hypothetical protein
MTFDLVVIDFSGTRGGIADSLVQSKYKIEAQIKVLVMHSVWM